MFEDEEDMTNDTLSCKKDDHGGTGGEGNR